MISRPPLTARSVVASTLLGVTPPRLPTLALVRSGEVFGLREGTTRTALSRMTARGELLAGDGHHELTGHLLERHGRQRAAQAPDAAGAWDGTWTLAVVTPVRRPAAERTLFREAAGRLALAEVREGLWARPGPVDPTRAPDAAARVNANVTWVRDSRPDDVDPFVAAFDLGPWAEAATQLRAEMAGAQPRLDASDTSAVGETFVIAAAVLRHLVADPRLPRELTPDAWPADALRADFRRFDDAFKATWRAWYRTFRQKSG